jgi:hypothetical protein
MAGSISTKSLESSIILNMNFLFFNFDHRVCVYLLFHCVYGPLCYWMVPTARPTLRKMSKMLSSIFMLGTQKILNLSQINLASSMVLFVTTTLVLILLLTSPKSLGPSHTFSPYHPPQYISYNNPYNTDDTQAHTINSLPVHHPPPLIAVHNHPISPTSFYYSNTPSTYLVHIIIHLVHRSLY